jgi:ABC-type phosphate transport system auxiliary subunit
MPDFEQRLNTLKNANRELQDALTVIAHLEARQSRLSKEQAEYLASHEKRLRQTEQRNQDTDARIEKLVSAIGTLIQKPQ